MTEKVRNDHPYPEPNPPENASKTDIEQTLPGDPRDRRPYTIDLFAAHDDVEYIEGYHVTLSDGVGACIVLSPGQVPHVIEFLQKAAVRGNAKKLATLAARRKHTAQVGATYVHVKSGKKYVVVAIEIDCDDNEGRERVAYVPTRMVGTEFGPHVPRYSRSRVQFEDGRFVLASEYPYASETVV